jgi:hypothetical protein
MRVESWKPTWCWACSFGIIHLWTHSKPTLLPTLHVKIINAKEHYTVCGFHTGDHRYFTGDYKKCCSLVLYHFIAFRGNHIFCHQLHSWRACMRSLIRCSYIFTGYKRQYSCKSWGYRSGALSTKAFFDVWNSNRYLSLPLLFIVSVTEYIVKTSSMLATTRQ